MAKTRRSIFGECKSQNSNEVQSALLVKDQENDDQTVSRYQESKKSDSFTSQSANNQDDISIKGGVSLAPASKASNGFIK
jgi:hypothetical protein